MLKDYLDRKRNGTHTGSWDWELYDLILSVRILPVDDETGQNAIAYDSNPKPASLKYGSTLLNDSSDLKKGLSPPPIGSVL